MDSRWSTSVTIVRLTDSAALFVKVYLNDGQYLHRTHRCSIKCAQGANIIETLGENDFPGIKKEELAGLDCQKVPSEREEKWSSVRVNVGEIGNLQIVRDTEKIESHTVVVFIIKHRFFCFFCDIPDSAGIHVQKWTVDDDVRRIPVEDIDFRPGMTYRDVLKASFDLGRGGWAFRLLRNPTIKPSLADVPYDSNMLSATAEPGATVAHSL
jgi:hypothetical protein